MDIKSRRLPEGFQEVEWIRASGGQYFVLPYYTNTNTEVVCEAYCENGNSIFGTFEAGKGFNITGGSATGKKYYYFTATTVGTTVTEGFHKYALGEYFSVDDVQLQHHEIVEYIESDFPLAIFARTYSATAISDSLVGKMKYLYVKESGIVLYYLIACYRKSDNVIGMYDIVNGVFYTNQGTGTFTKGVDVVTVDTITIPTGTVKQIADSNGNIIWKRLSLPSGYTEKEGIRFTTQAGIVTDATLPVITATDASIQIKATFKTPASLVIDKGIIGSWKSNTDMINFIWVYSAAGLAGLYYMAVGQNIVYTLAADTQYFADITVKNGEQTIKLNGTTVASGTLTTSVDNSENHIGICCRGDSTIAQTAGEPGTIVNGLEVIKNGVLVGLFIPCVRDSDNLAGFYNLITNNFCYGDGTLEAI